MNAVEAFAVTTQWMLLRIEWLRLYVKRKGNRTPLPLKEKGRYDLGLNYDGDIAKMFSTYGENFLSNNPPPDESYAKDVRSVRFCLELLFYWSWIVRRIYSFDIPSQRNLKNINISGVTWGDLRLPFPTTFIEFQAEFFVWGREYDSVLFIDDEDRNDENCPSIIFISRKRAAAGPCQEGYEKLHRKVRSTISSPDIDLICRDENEIVGNVFFFARFKSTSKTLISESDRGFQMCVRAILAITKHKPSKSETPGDYSQPLDGPMVEPENYFQVDVETVARIEEPVSGLKIISGDKKRELKRHPRTGYFRAPKGLKYLGKKTEWVKSTIVNKHKVEDQMPVNRVQM